MYNYTLKLIGEQHKNLHIYNQVKLHSYIYNLIKKWLAK